nr:glycoside hydrolase family 16 protein [uncultured Shewanella sp.]
MMNNSIRKIASLWVLLSLFAGVSACGDSESSENESHITQPLQPVDDWEMVWNDEFDGAAIDEKKWTREQDCSGSGNEEQQCYTDSDENAYVENGILHIVAKPAEQGAEKPYTSARLVSRYQGDFTYGRYEIRAKLPSGQGSWPAFWLLPTDEVYGSWPKSGEIDIVEAVNLKVKDDDGRAENRIYGSLHYGKEWPNNVYSGKDYAMANNPADDFHEYAIEWQAGEIRWYVDDYLYATQRQSDVFYNSKGEAAGLVHRGWFSEYYDASTGELTTHWDLAPFDQAFYMILNLAVGGNWPENVNALGIDADAFAQGQHLEVDYIRVYQCNQNLNTGKGCETVRGGYDNLNDALVEGLAPIPVAMGDAELLRIFYGEMNPNWPAWDCCGGGTPRLVSDELRGDVMEFYVNAEPTVNGFITKDPFITDPKGMASPYDASPLLVDGYLRFDLKVIALPQDVSATWYLKLESTHPDTEISTAVELALFDSLEGNTLEGNRPQVGEWQTYTFPVQTLMDAGLDVSSIDVVMIFPAWGQGEGAVYQIDNLVFETPPLIVFEDSENDSWPMWDCCGGTTPAVKEDDVEHGAVAEFVIGDIPTVMGFISKSDFVKKGAQAAPYDASHIAQEGVVQFDMKVVSQPSNAEAAWLFKIESHDALYQVEWPLEKGNDGQLPLTGEWQTYTFSLNELVAAGLDVSAIDVLLIFPSWGQGEGAVYRIDNLKIILPDEPIK